MHPNVNRNLNFRRYIAAEFIDCLPTAQRRSVLHQIRDKSGTSLFGNRQTGSPGRLKYSLENCRICDSRPTFPERCLIGTLVATEGTGH